MPATQSLRDDLRQHGDNVLTKLVTITLVLVTVIAFVDRNTNYQTSADYLLLICLSAGLILLIECVGHLRHRRRLLAGRVAS